VAEGPVAAKGQVAAESLITAEGLVAAEGQVAAKGQVSAEDLIDLIAAVGLIAAKGIFAKADADDATEDNKANKAEASTIIVYLCCLRPFPLTKYCAIFSKDKEYFCPRPIANNN
jgi:hypothetical protein